MEFLSFDSFSVTIIVVIAALMVPNIFYLLTLQNVLKRVDPERRTLEPGYVWLNLIPIFNYVWRFVIVNRMAASLKAEFEYRQIDIGEANPGQETGRLYCIFHVVRFVPFIGGILGLAGIVLWIVYWNKIHRYGKMLPLDPSTDILDHGNYLKAED